MSPIFNRHALNGLSATELEKLRSLIRQRLCSDQLREQERINLVFSLDAIEAVLRTRMAATPPAPRLGF
jgi:tRNA A37 threonylcarbamoyladenosine dehydratase